MIRPRQSFPLLALAASSLFAVAAPPLPGTPAARSEVRARSGDDEADDRAATLLVAERAVRENCLICHSDDLIRTQRLTPAQWKTEIDKMIGWGAPVPSDVRAVVIDHLAATYPATAAPVPPHRLAAGSIAGLRVLAVGVGKSGEAGRGATLYAVNCANCHGADGQGAELGPNLVERRALLDTEGYDEVVRNGRGRMPGFARVFQGGEGSDVLAWLRTRRFQPVLPAR